MHSIIEEGKARIRVSEGKITKKLPVFYNPAMEYNRTISVLLLNSAGDRNMQIGLPLAGSGIRGIRFLLELRKAKIKNITFNDFNERAVENIKENLMLNKMKPNKKIGIENKDANIFLLESSGFDYIDIDPFGTPNPFLDSAVKRLARCGILAVTATDTGCLCGTYPKTCIRKYWAAPLRNEIMHEFGLRILIRKIQMIGAQFDKALEPVFSYSRDHYFRVFLRCAKGKKKVDEILKKHQFFNTYNVSMRLGPVWTGQLWDPKLVSAMAKNQKDAFLETIKKESRINTAGFHDIHALAKRHKLQIPKTEELFKKIRKAGYKVSPTHFSRTGLRSNIGLKELIKLF